jgi:hypothetical protein
MDVDTLATAAYRAIVEGDDMGAVGPRRPSISISTSSRGILNMAWRNTSTTPLMSSSSFLEVGAR